VSELGDLFGRAIHGLPVTVTVGGWLAVALAVLALLTVLDVAWALGWVLPREIYRAWPRVTADVRAVVRALRSGARAEDRGRE
jgi:hypothetical protein